MGLQPIPPRREPLRDRALGHAPPPIRTVGMSPLDSLKRRYVEGWIGVAQFEAEVEALLVSEALTTS